MKRYKYNSWPAGKLPKKFQRPELENLSKLGIKFSDPRDVVDIFEKRIAKYCNSKYAVLTDCASHAIFLTLKYLNKKGFIYCPVQTYVSVPMQIIHAGYKPKFINIDWTGTYQLDPLPIQDSSMRFHKGMYNKNENFEILSFQIKKILPIGRGGAILTNNYRAYKWLKLSTYDGRDLTSKYDSKNHVSSIGWHFYMTPEDAARGIILLSQLPDYNKDLGGAKNYPPITKFKYFENYKIMNGNIK